MNSIKKANKLSRLFSNIWFNFFVWVYYLSIDFSRKRKTRLKLLSTAFRNEEPQYQEYRDITRGYKRGKAAVRFILICMFIAAIIAAVIVTAIR